MLKTSDMQTKIIQVIALMLIVAFAASCATSNEYVNKLFAPRPIPVKDSLRLVKFLELDSINGNEDQWVKTDIARKDTTIVSAPASEPVVKTSIPENPSTENPLPIVQGTRTKKVRE